MYWPVSREKQHKLCYRTTELRLNPALAFNLMLVARRGFLKDPRAVLLPRRPLTGGGADEHFVAAGFSPRCCCCLHFSDAIFCACAVQVVLTSNITSSCAVKRRKFFFVIVLQKARQLASSSRGNPPKEILHCRRGCGTNTSAEAVPGSICNTSAFMPKTFQCAFRKE